MTTRRKLLVALGASTVVAPFASFAQPRGKVWRIGFLGVASASGYVNEIDAIRGGLRELGYVEGRNIAIESRWADGSPERLKEMAAELVALNCDVIITHAILGARTLGQATKSIPIVMADGADPVDAGVVASYARPGGNITGTTSFQTEIHAKRLELLKEVLPRLTRVAFLFNPKNSIFAVHFRQMEIAAKRMTMDLEQFAVREFEELPGIFTAMAKKRIEGTVVGEDPLLNSNAAVIAALAATHRLPTSGFTNFAGAGGLLGYGPNRSYVYGRAAYFVDKILKGAKPGDLPIERATRFELIVNMKTAKALGIKIQQTFLQRADKVIE